MNNQAKNITCTINVEDGKIEIDLIDYIAHLSEEQKRELLQFGGYWAFVFDGLLKDIMFEYSTQNYNPTIQQLRRALLSDQNLPHMLKNFLIGLNHDYVAQVRRLQEYETAYYRIYHNDEIKANRRIREIVIDAHQMADRPLPRDGWISQFVDTMLAENNINLAPFNDEDIDGITAAGHGQGE